MQSAVTCIDTEDTWGALRYLAELHAPLVIAKQRGQSQPQLMADIAELEESVWRHQCIAASSQARLTLG